MSTLITTHRTPTDSTAVAQKGLLARHPIAAYFVLAYAGTWIVELPLVLSRNGIGLIPLTLPFLTFAVVFVLSAYTGPTLAAFVMTAATEGRSGVRQLLRRYVQWRVGVQWYLIPFFGYLALNLLAAMPGLGVAPVLHALGQNWLLIFTAYLPAVLTFNLITVLGEEPGWRGFALPRLQQKYGPFWGSMILGTLHGFWHLPVFFLPALGFGKVTPSFFLTWLPAVWATTILFTWLFNSAKGSLLIAFLMHATSDAAVSFVFYTVLGINTVSVAVKARVSLAVLVGLVGAALLVIALTRGRLGYKRVSDREPESSFVEHQSSASAAA